MQVEKMTETQVHDFVNAIFQCADGNAYAT